MQPNSSHSGALGPPINGMDKAVLNVVGWTFCYLHLDVV